MKSPIEAVIDMEHALFRARCYFEAMDACAGDDRPSWLFAFFDQLSAIEAAMEPLSLAVRSSEDVQ